MLMNFLRSVGLLAMVVTAAPGVAQSLQLADGRVLLAKVEDADGAGLRVRRLDNGGMLDLRWDHLSAASAFEVKKQYSLAGDSQEQQLLVRVEEIEYTSGGSKQWLIGRIVDRGSDPLIVQSKGRQYPIPRKDLGPVRSVEVPVMQVYTRDEFYAERRSALQPGDKADVHVLLAEELLRVGDYDRASEHLTVAKQLNNSRDPGQIDVLTARTQRFKEAAKEAKAIEDIAAARARGTLIDFEKGTKLILQFDKDFPQCKLKAEFEAEKKRFTAARQRFLIGQVAETFRSSIAAVADKKVVEAGLTLEAAREYAASKMTDDLVARVVTMLRLDAEEVKTLWAARKDAKTKKSDTFSYGLGSWVLGEEAILKNTTIGKDKDKAKGDAAKDPNGQRDIDRYLKAMQAAMKARAQSGQAPGEGEQPKTEEDWWREASRADKGGWLRAFYAENGGQLVVTMASLTPCPACYAEGHRMDINGEGKTVRIPCYLCQKTKYLRSFRAW